MGATIPAELAAQLALPIVLEDLRPDIQPAPGTQAAGRGRYAWLTTEHPIYKAMKARWVLNEARLEGGDAVIPELRRFEWETKEGPDSAYGQRQAQAVYFNFPMLFMVALTGHLARHAPTPDAGLSFGTMGQVRRDRSAGDETEAELVYYNVDGVGNEGSHWQTWWLDVMTRAGATGHRWIYVETPSTPPATEAQVRDEGLRPYLVEFSPLSVINWHYEAGQLDFAVIRFQRPDPKVNDRGELVEASREDFLLLVREGCRRLGPTFQAGGWWKFDDQLDAWYDTGDFEDTGGQIPLFPLYYQRAKGRKGAPAMSRPGLTELGNAAIAYMNLDSAANFDAWDAAKSLTYMLGVDAEAFNIAKEKMDEGSRWIPVQANEDTDETPQIHDGGTGAVVADVFDRRLQALKEVAAELGVLELTRGNSTSGASKTSDFLSSKGPRLAIMAQELSIAQTTAIYFLELSFGHTKPAGSTTWTTQFNLVEVVGRIKDFFETERLSGIRSETLDAKAMTMLGRERGLIESDEEAKKVEKEYQESARKRNELEAAKAGELQDAAMKTGAEAAGDKAREAAKKVDGNPKQNTTGQPGAGRPVGS